MAQETSRIQKIYDLKSLGSRDLISELDIINTKFREIKQSKQELGRLRVSITEDPGRLKQVNSELAQLKIEEQELINLQKKKKIELEQLRILRQIELEQQRAAKAEKKKEAEANQALSGSYNDLAKRYRELLNISKNSTNLFNPTEIKEATDELKRLKVQLDAFNRSLSPDGTLVSEYSTGIINAFKKLGLDDVITNQVNKSKQKLDELDRKADELAVDLKKIGKAGQEGFQQLEQELKENRVEADQLKNKINEMETALHNTGTIGEQVLRGIKDSFSNLKKEAVSFFIAYLGFQQAISAAREDIRINKIISDQLTDLQRVLQVSDEVLANIEERIRNIDTRTGLEKLFDFAIIAAKAGVAQKDIAGVTKAIDELYLVAGKELGNVDETINSIVKLIAIFRGEGQVTEENIRRFGNAIVDLANKGVASGGYLVDYAQRLAGIQGISKIQIESVLGLAAAFEEQGQSAEVAATAVTQLILKMGADVPKYAALAKMSQESFRTLLNENPAEALIVLSERVKGSSTAFDEIASKFPELEARGVRVAGTLGVLADKADFFRDKIKIAGQAMADTSAISEGAAKKQENFAAKMEKTRKELELIGTNRTVQAILLAVASALGFIVGNITPLIGLITTYGVVWGIANATLIKTRVATIASNVAFQAQYAWLVLAELWTKAYSAALVLYTNRQNAATAAAVLFRQVMFANPFGAVVAILGLVVAAFTVFDAILTDTTGKLKEQAEEAGIMNDIYRKSSAAIADETSKLRTHYQVAKNTKLSYDTRKKSMEELMKISPEFNKAIDGETISLDKLRIAYNNVTKAIKATAEAQAATSLAAERQKSILQIVSIRQAIETEAAISGAKKGNLINVSAEALGGEEAIKLLTGGITGNELTNATIDKGISSSSKRGISFYAEALPNIIAFLKKQEDQRTKIYEDYLNVSQQKQAALNELQNKQDAQVSQDLKEKAAGNNLTISELKKLIETIDNENSVLKESDPKLKENLRLREQYQARLDKALNKGGNKGLSLDNADKIGFKNIDAGRDTSITQLKTAFAEKKEFNGQVIDSEIKYLQQLQVINETAINKKLSLLTGKNAEEKRIMADLRLDLIIEKQKTNDDIYKLELQAVEAKTELQKEQARKELESVENTPLSTDLDKATARLNYYNRLLSIQQRYNAEADNLEKRYNQQSIKNETDRRKAIEEARRATDKALLDNTKAAIDNEFDEIEARYQKRIAVIQNSVYSEAFDIVSGNGSAKSRKAKIDKLERNTSDAVFDAEIARLNEEEEQYQHMLDTKLISEQQFAKAKSQLDEQRYNIWKRLLDKEVADEEKANARKQQIQETAFRIADNYINSSISQQNNLIDKNYQEGLSYQDKEKQKRLENAKSKAEEIAIEEEFEQRKKELERQRSSERKELMKKQLAMEFAVASLRAVSAALSVPGAGLAEALVAEGLVAAEYGAKLLILESQQFAKGGQVPNNGGQIGGKPHSLGGTKFMYGGQAFEAEYKELFIINKKSADSNDRLSVTGTPKQIASAINAYGGGVNFAPGAGIGRFEYGGALGGSLQAPYFSGSNNSTDFEDIRSSFVLMRDGMYVLANTVKNIEVRLDPAKAKKGLKDYEKQVNIGAL